MPSWQMPSLNNNKGFLEERRLKNEKTAIPDPVFHGGFAVLFEAGCNLVPAVLPTLPGSKAQAGKKVRASVFKALISPDTNPANALLTRRTSRAGGGRCGVRRLGARGALGAVVFSSGFAEVGAEGARSRLLFLRRHPRRPVSASADPTAREFVRATPCRSGMWPGL